MSHPVDEILQAQKRGEVRGLPSICSAHPWVLKTALHGERPVLIESTCNQVNQFGGYTGMTPIKFAAFVRQLAAENDFPAENVLLGGDHLGPSPWQDEPAELAMSRAAEMVQAYVQAGFTKLHLDTSMRLGDDNPARPLDPELATRRTALLAWAAEEAHTKAPKPSQDLCYVIGTEVPIPGGATEPEARLCVTKVEDARRTLEVTRAAFMAARLESAWERVVALVVQPGVEFGDGFVLDYNPEAAQELKHFAETIPLVYEAHSTDYQRRPNLRKLVRDHFAILKAGPALTFAFREAVFSLAMIEAELIPGEQQSHLIETLEAAMLDDPRHWQRHYHGSEQELALSRKFSLSDRVRYYWRDTRVQAAFECLLQNLTAKPLPLTLISQYAPIQYEHIRRGEIEPIPADILFDRVRDVLRAYNFACGR